MSTQQLNSAQQQQWDHFVSAAKKLGITPTNTNLDILREAAIKKWQWPNNTVVEEQALLVVYFDVRDQVEMDPAVQAQNEARAASEALARQIGRASELEARDRKEGRNPWGYKSEAQAKADALAEAKSRRESAEKIQKDAAERKKAEAAEAARLRHIEENPSQYLIDFTVDQPESELRKMPTNVLKLWMQKRRDFLQRERAERLRGKPLT